MKRIIISISAFLILTHPIRALEPYEVEGYFQAGEYAPIQEYYDQLLTTPLSSVQKAIVEYDLGTLLLVEGKWKEAYAQFQEISLGNDPPEYLIERINFNSALALYQETISQRGKASLKLSEASFLLDEAQEARCQWMKRAGTKDCQMPQKYLKLKKDISQKQLDLATLPKSSSTLFETEIPQDLKDVLLLIYPEIFVGLEFDKAIDATSHYFYQKLISIGDLEKIKSDYKNVGRALEILKKDGSYPLNYGLIQENYQRALSQLDEALKGVQSDEKHIAIQIALREANQSLLRGWWLLNARFTTNPKNILIHAIEEESYAFWLDKHPTIHASKLKLPSQEETKQVVLKTALPFFQSVINEQTKNYGKGCQRELWDEVVPLFDRGYTSAEANDYKNSLTTWKQALKIIEENDSKFRTSQSGNSQMEQLVQQLEEMDYQDRSIKKPATQELYTPPGVKPW